MNDLDVSESGNIGAPQAADLHAAHVPPGVPLLQVLHGHGEHQLDRVVENAHLVLRRVGRTGVVRSSQAGAELLRRPAAPIFHIAGVVRLIVTRHFEGLTLQDRVLSRCGYSAQEGWWRAEMTEC